MAIVPITKVRLFVYRQDVAKMLEIAQKIGAIEFKKIDEIDGFLIESNLSSGENISKLTKIKQAVAFLSNYEEKLGTFAKLKKGSLINLSENDLGKRILDKSDLETILQDLSALELEFNNGVAELLALNEKRVTLLPWKNLSVSLGSLKTNYILTYLFRVKNVKKVKDQNLTLSEQVSALFNKENIESYIEDLGDQYFSVTVPVDTDNNLVLQIIKSLGGEIINLSGYANKVVDEIEYLDKRITDIENTLGETKIKLALFAKNHSEKIKIAHDALVWDCDRELVGGVAKYTKHITVFEGWANKNNLPIFEKKIKEESLLCDLAEVSLSENEIPPVEIENNALVKPFEIVTRLNGLPSHKDIDPTPFMAVFFFVFFGLCLTDVGYGALLMLLTLPFLFYFKVSKIAKQFSQLIFLMGLSTVVIGMFFGGYFGISMSEMPKFLQDLQAFDPIGNPLPVFYLALSLGVIQVMVGMVLRIVSESKNGQLINGLLDQGPWLLLFTLLIVYGASVFEYLSFDEERIVTLIYLAVAFVILASGRTGETILGKIQMSLLSVYNSINYLSDILSYSRLLALGLATSALAFAVNLIAGIVYELIPYVGAILAILVLIVGHVFTLVINTLGSFIHSARLQFVEFFGKFITGTGREFKPLTRKESYTSLLKEDSG